MKKLKAHMHDQPGQSLIIVAFGIITLVAFVGLAVDVGTLYVERIRVRRAADAAALAAAADLPLERAAHARALEYLEENSYPCGLWATWEDSTFSYGCSNTDARVVVNGSPMAGTAAEDSAQRIISINTEQYRSEGRADSATKIEVNVATRAPLYFMRVLGFESLPVNGRAVGENINTVDVVLVFDKSGSMEFDTLCYGCWTAQDGLTYPNGTLHPLPWSNDGDAIPDHTQGPSDDLVYDYRVETYHHHYTDYKAIILEAEDYSYNSVPYDRDLYTQGMTYWVLQRNGGTRSDNPQLTGDGDYLVGTPGSNNSPAGAYGRDDTGAYMSHHPFWGGGVNCRESDVESMGVCRNTSDIIALGGPFPVPRLDYEFTLPNDGGGQWYFYARGAAGGNGNDYMWALNTDSGVEEDEFSGGYGRYYSGAAESTWVWDAMGSRWLSGGHSYTLSIYAGDMGVDIDRIILSTHSSLDGMLKDDRVHIDNHRTGSAQDPCDARYGGHPGGTGIGEEPYCSLTRFTDDIYDDEQPVRGAVEAAKHFVAGMDPAYDQVGLVTYSNRAAIKNELECARRLGSELCTSQVISDTVIASLDATHANGGTNIAEAMMKGINVLSNTDGHLGRPAAAHIMVLMTDGEANVYSGVDTSFCDSDNWTNDNETAKDCVIGYAREARRNGIVIYTITLGDSADIELLSEVANLTGGIHRHAPRVEQLGPIFDELQQRIFLRLVE